LKISKIKVTSSHARIQVKPMKKENNLIESLSISKLNQETLIKKCDKQSKSISEDEILNPLQENHHLQSKKEFESLNNDYLKRK